MELSGIGIWSGELRYGDAGEIALPPAELEALGYTALWIPDVGGDVFGALRTLLDATTTVVAATGILNLWMHSADDVGAGFAALEADHPEPHAARHRRQPLAAHRADPPGPVQEAVAGHPPVPRRPRRRPPTVPRDRRVLAALGPKMLELARDRAGGAHPYLVTPEHTEVAREVLGEGPLLRPSSTSCSRPTPPRPAPSPARASPCTCSSRATT